VRLPAHLAGFSFDAEQFRALCGRLAAPAGDPAAWPVAPRALDPHSAGPGVLREWPTGADADALRARGERAIRDGRVAALVLNGGMATRFGGGAKGIERVVPDRADTFLSAKLGDCAWRARAVRGRIPVVVMNSFATAEASLAHLEAIDWAGVPGEDRRTFDQSIMPRTDLGGTPLCERPDAHGMSDADLFAAPGHGDALGRLRESGTLTWLAERGVDDVFVSNVDNLGATLDPVAVGAHLAAVDDGFDVTVEVVVRRPRDAGGFVALVGDRAVIVEGFRMPADADPTDHVCFNTNTLWLRRASIERDVPLTWFSVRKQLERADGTVLGVVQFERLIGQLTELAPSAYLWVDREERFLPIKTRADLAAAEDRLRLLLLRLEARRNEPGAAQASAPASGS
jgi:UTP--glucose-1-phosphate uridylyltransferase